jgi:hypothetical protein
MTRPPDRQQPADQGGPEQQPTLRDALDVLRRHFGDVQVLEVRAHEPTVATARRRQQTTRPWRLFP